MTALQKRRFTRVEYYRLNDLGFFRDGQRVELLRGEIVVMPAKGSPHEACLNSLMRFLLSVVSEQFLVRCQSPIALPDDSEPEPDFSIVSARDDEYARSHPQPSDTLLAIEISDSSLEIDRGVKLALYAEAGIPVYWIFNLIEHVVEAYSDPRQTEQGGWTYFQRQIFERKDRPALPIAGEPEVDLARVRL